MLLLLLFVIVIESLLFPVLIICVLFDWSVSLSQKKKVCTVGCTLWLALSRQIKILFKFYFEKLLKVIKKSSCLIFFVTATLFSPLPPLLSILKLWFNFILGLNFIFSFFNSLSYITIPKNLPTLEAWEIACQGKQRCQPRLLILETLYFSLSPSPRLSTAPITPLPVGEINQVKKILTLLCAAH